MKLQQFNASSPEDWQILRVLSVYRIVLAGMLVVLFYTKVAPNVLGDRMPDLFQTLSYGYLAASTVFLFLLQRDWPPLRWQAYFQFGVDSLAISILAYASAGVPSGLGTLLITPTVACSLILSARLSLLLASLATVLLFAEELFRQLPDEISVGAFTQTGILGGILMITALAGSMAAARARKSEARAARVGTELASMSRLNENVVEMLQSGIMVIEPDGVVRLLNAAARRLLDAPVEPTGRNLELVSPPLLSELQKWQADEQYQAQAFLPHSGATELLPRITRLGWGKEAPLLVMLDDIAQLSQQAQQIKLAALGRLSASIAHEIRNPLAAISHAGQLMEEASDLNPENKRLLQMVRRHSGRINKIISDVLSLSRREGAMVETLPLREWLEGIVRQYEEANPNRSGQIDMDGVSQQLQVDFDASHLQQILGNLWDNAFHHAQADGAVQVRLRSGQREDGRHWLEIADNGQGVAADISAQIYEPFFTTNHQGTGLGLFMARQLCEHNRARLSYEAAQAGACFRILFPAPANQDS